MAGRVSNVAGEHLRDLRNAFVGRTHGADNRNKRRTAIGGIFEPPHLVGTKRVQQLGAKNAYGLGASTRQSGHRFVGIPACWAIKRSPRPTAVLQILLGQERKFDTKCDAKFGAPSTAALAFIGNSARTLFFNSPLAAQRRNGIARGAIALLLHASLPTTPSGSRFVDSVPPPLGQAQRGAGSHFSTREYPGRPALFAA